MKKIIAKIWNKIKAMRMDSVDAFCNCEVRTTTLDESEVPEDIRALATGEQVDDCFVVTRVVEFDDIPKDLIRINGLEDIIKACDNQVSLADMPD